jgi:hypothetical protein
MEILGSLPVWIQLLIAVLVAAVLVVMNIGWLMQARGWLEQQRHRRAPGTGTTPPESRPGTPRSGGA